MFCVIYRWRVKPGKEDTFREIWRRVTVEIYRENQSFGSRLHRSEDSADGDVVFVAYAQWPDRETWETGTKALAAKVQNEQDWEDCVDGEGSTLYRLTLLDDLLKQTQFEPVSEQ